MYTCVSVGSNFIWGGGGGGGGGGTNIIYSDLHCMYEWYEIEIKDKIFSKLVKQIHPYSSIVTASTS